MKFVDMEEIWKKYPNKYVAIVAAAKEARKIIETRKPPSPPRSVDAPVTAETVDTTCPGSKKTRVWAVPEPAPIEPPAPKKRGRKPKKLAVESTNFNHKINTKLTQDFSFSGDNLVKSRPIRRSPGFLSGVAREKTEVNVYIEALKKVLK